MARAVRPALARVWVVLSASVTALVLEVGPHFGGTPPTAAYSAELVALTLVLTGAVMAACLLRTGTGSCSVAPARSPAPSAGVPVPRGRATDPTHHPLAPRAPGTA